MTFWWKCVNFIYKSDLQTLDSSREAESEEIITADKSKTEKVRTGGAEITASAGGGGRGDRGKNKQGKKYASVVKHFEDAAFDDAHVSVPHNLVSAGQKTKRQKERKLWVNGAERCWKSHDKLLLWNLGEESKWGNRLSTRRSSGEGGSMFLFMNISLLSM